MSEIVVNSYDELDETVAGVTGPVLALFTAPTWCVPCRQFEPHWKKAQNTEALENFTFVKVEMGETPEDTGNHWATEEFQIMGVPTLLKFTRDGEFTETEAVQSRAVVPLIRELTS